MEKRCTFFHVDDSEDELFLVHELVELSGLPLDLKQFDSAAGFLTYLESLRGPTRARIEEIPAFLLLDYSLRPSTAPEVITRMRALGGWQWLPIIVYSNSSDVGDANRSYAAGANHFVTKPAQLSGIRWIIQTLYRCATSPDRDYTPLEQMAEHISFQPRASSVSVFVNQ